LLQLKNWSDGFKDIKPQLMVMDQVIGFRAALSFLYVAGCKPCAYV
jgi:hypothetical protein